MAMKCGSMESFKSENLNTLTYGSHKIDYALYKAEDPVQSKVKTCHLQGSPQVLLSMYAF